MSLLKIRIKDCSHQIRDMYEKQIRERDPMDAGFDLFVPEPHAIRKLTTSHKIDHKVQIEYNFANSPAYILMPPRSSISKTSLRLANSIGVIDSGYRGNLMAYVDNLGTEKVVKAGASLFQLIVGENCEIQIIDNLSESRRGTGGFGSTGNV